MKESEIVKKISLSKLSETPYWKTLTCDGVEEEVKEILIRFDLHLQQLGVEYDKLYEPCDHYDLDARWIMVDWAYIGGARE